MKLLNIYNMGGKKRRAIAREAKEAADASLQEAQARQEAAQAGVDRQRAAYESFEFTNPFAGMENPYAENVYEDLTVNQQQAQFQAQQGSQQRANIMQNMKGAAGGSGIAGLAQALANQGALQTQQISASIGQQESRNQMAAARGASAVQIAERQGDQFVQQAEMDRQATLLGMQMGQTTGANLAEQQAQANQMNAQIAQSNAITGLFGVAAKALGSGDKNIFTGEEI